MTTAASEPEILLALIKEQWSQARQIEAQRSTMTYLILAVASGIQFLFVGMPDETNRIVGGAVIASLGALGLVFSVKFYETFRFHVGQARALRVRLYELFPEGGIAQKIEVAKSSHRASHPRLTKIRLHRLWDALHVTIILIGLSYMVFG